MLIFEPNQENHLTEAYHEPVTPQQRVFGDVFSFEHGPADDETVIRFMDARALAAESGQITWVPYYLGANDYVLVTLKKHGKDIALLDYEADSHTATVYTRSADGVLGGAICNEVSFEEAVVQAEKYATQLQ